jgi:hypothetical protein
MSNKEFDLSYDEGTGEMSVKLPDVFTGEEIDELLEYVERSAMEAMVDEALCGDVDDDESDHALSLEAHSAFSCHLRGLASLLQEEVGVHYDRFTYYLASASCGDDSPSELEDAASVNIIQIYDEAYFAVAN